MKVYPEWSEQLMWAPARVWKPILDKRLELLQKMLFGIWLQAAFFEGWAYE